jgi:hypothetical protein
MLTEKSPKISYKFTCEKCNYRCSKNSEFTKHKLTAKHIRLTYADGKIIQSSNNENKKYECHCGNVYLQRQSLYRHKQSCKLVPENMSITNEIAENNNDNTIVQTMMQLIKQNQELLVSNQQFKELIIEQQHENQKQQHENHILQSQLIEAVKDTGNTYNNNTINNNQNFNLNFFLNTTCKDAMNMSDFIENMEINFKDIENIGKNGYVNGMTEMILSRIKELDVTKRPLHCTDLKRETMYIKDNDEWCKDTPDNSKLHKTIGYVAKRNYATIPLWREKYPECQNWNDPKYDFCVDMMRNILGDIGEKQTRLDNKVIKNLSKHITIEKK